MTYRLITLKDSNDMWGWNGYVKETETGKRWPLIKTVVDYVLDGEAGYATCAFDTYAEMKAAAQRKVNQILKGKRVAR